MTDFTQTAVSMSAKREFTAPIAELATFESVISSLMADETIGLTKREQTSVSYTAKIAYFDVAENEKGKMSITAEDRSAYEACIALFTGNEAAETVAGMGGTASEDGTKALWNARISCAIDDDSFTVSLNRDNILISGYAKAATLAAIEAWADTVDALA